jgi:hypothetical protein
MACSCACTVVHPYLGQPGQRRALQVHSTNNKPAVLACLHRDNHVVRKVELTSGAYTVTTIAGSAGQSGFKDGKAYCFYGHTSLHLAAPLDRLNFVALHMHLSTYLQLKHQRQS